jgi:hypothetical protein
MGAKKNAYKILVGKHEEKRPLGRLRRRWEEKIYMGIRDICIGSIDWSHLAEDRDHWGDLFNTLTNLRVP